VGIAEITQVISLPVIRSMPGAAAPRWQVSWLAGHDLLPAFPVTQWRKMAANYPLTVAGAATV
jgi:hypothetical protein